ncbi:hypothetical protein TNCV_4514941 [Trichonephila clavipes]|nr:hypothetical protein TNCV_4514941 [Trichonephila clavipes]
MGFPTSTQAEYLSMVRCKIPLHRLFCYLFRPLHRRNEVEKSNLYTGYFVICSDLYTGGMKLKNPTSTQVERSFRKMAERLLHGRCCSLSRLWFKIEILSIPVEPP